MVFTSVGAFEVPDRGEFLSRRLGKQGSSRSRVVGFLLRSTWGAGGPGAARVERREKGEKELLIMRVINLPTNSSKQNWL